MPARLAVRLFMTHNSERRCGLVVMPEAFVTTNSAKIISLAERFRLPTIYPYRFYCMEGGLMSYGILRAELYQQAALYVDRILRGEKPADLPVQAPSRFELVVNAKTAICRERYGAVSFPGGFRTPARWPLCVWKAL